MGRVLGAMDLAPTAIDTRGYASLLSLVDNTTNDSFDLYYGLFMYNAVRAPMPSQTLPVRKRRLPTLQLARPPSEAHAAHRPPYRANSCPRACYTVLLKHAPNILQCCISTRMRVGTAAGD